MEIKRPKVGVGVIVKKDNKVLMQKRINAHGNQTWSFPGGHLEFNESIEACAEREVMEEIGIKIKNIKLGTFTNDIFEKEGKHYITLFAIAEHESGEPKIMEPQTTQDFGWFSWDSLPSPLFLPLVNLKRKGFDPFQEEK